MTVVAIAHSAAFAWAFLQLRRDTPPSAGRRARAAPTGPDADDWMESPSRRGRAEGPATAAGHRDRRRSPPSRSRQRSPAGDAAAAGRRRRAARAAPPAPAPAAEPRRRRASDPDLDGPARLRRARDRRLVPGPPRRADRSARTGAPCWPASGGGRLDRLDLWILVVLVVGSLLLRTFRLAEPYQMHFDEVYHARTATEFLQDWRYGLSHDIYEWTHPHLAKYAMAAGLVLWGEDQVDATSDLGVPVRDAIIEPRREDPAAPGGQAGDRLHVATGTEIRTYDLATREPVSVVPAPGPRRSRSMRPGGSWSSATTTAGSRRSTRPRSARSPWTSARRRAPSVTARPPGPAPPDDRRRDLGRRRVGGPAERRRPADAAA